MGEVKDGGKRQMRSYSMDLRERIIKAWEAGRPQTWLVETFGVSLATVQRYIARYKATGSVAPTKQQRQQPLIRPEQHELLREMVRQTPDAELPEYCAEWAAATGVVVSPKTMSRELVKLGLRRKKNGRRRGA